MSPSCAQEGKKSQFDQSSSVNLTLHSGLFSTIHRVRHKFSQVNHIYVCLCIVLTYHELLI